MVRARRHGNLVEGRMANGREAWCFGNIYLGYQVWLEKTEIGSENPAQLLYSYYIP